MKGITILNNDGSTKEKILLPAWALDKVIEYAREVKRQIDEQEGKDEYPVLFG